MTFAFNVLLHLLEQTVYFVFVLCIFLCELQTVILILSLQQISVDLGSPVYFCFPPVFLCIHIYLWLDFVHFMHFEHLLNLAITFLYLREVQTLRDHFHLQPNLFPGLLRQLVQLHSFFEGELIHGRKIQNKMRTELKGTILQKLFRLIIYHNNNQMSGSLQSHISNLGNSFINNGRLLNQSDFFKASLPYQAPTKSKSHSKAEVAVDSLFCNSSFQLNPQKTSMLNYPMNWMNDGKNQAQGISDDEYDDFHPQNEGEEKIKVEEKVKIEEEKKDSELMAEQKGKKNKNETKNIPKNFGKAIIIFIEKNKKMLKKIFQQQNVEFREVLDELQHHKKNINTIADLRYFWTDCKYAKSMRVISNLFLRKYSYSYIFNSRIKSRLCHVKYKKRLEEALKEPNEFLHIKDY